MLAVTGSFPDSDTGWAYEPKWNGVRALVAVSHGRIRVSGQHAAELTDSFPELHAVGALLPDRDAVLDGEIVTLDEAGLPRPTLLQRRLSVAAASAVVRLARDIPATYMAFDLLRLDGRSLLDAPYDHRRAMLRSLRLAGTGVATTPAYVDTPGSEVYRAAIRRGIEGVVAKRRDSAYRPGRQSADWIAVKAVRTQEIVIAGWTPGQGRLTDSFGALIMGVPEGGELTFVGKVGAGFDTVTRVELLNRMRPLLTDVCPFREPPDTIERIDAHYIRPELVGEVRFTEWTRDGRMRHPSWRGLRPDRSAQDVVRDG
jgi:bifunctional non-homologous end joining protein LigD